MRDLKTLREGWDEVEREERRIAERLAEITTIEQSVRDFLSLCQDFAPFIEATKSFFRPEREAYLTELQTKLRRFADWERGRDEKAFELD